MNEVFSGKNAYLIIEDNNQECPYRNPAGVTPVSENLVYLNGIAYVKSTYDAPYDSVANLITAFPNATIWIFNEDTGQGYYFDGTQAGDSTIFWPPEKRAIGKCQSIKPAYKRGLEFQGSVGDMFPNQIDEDIYQANFSLDKTFIDKVRMSVPVKSSAMNSLFGFLGSGVLERDEYLIGIKNNWYLIIIYIVDKSDDSDNVARSLIFPCAKFSEIQPTSEVDRIIRCTLQGKATYMKTVPHDEENIPVYTPTDITPFPCPTLKILIDNTGLQLSYIGNSALDVEAWNGEDFTTGIVGGFNLCAVKQRFSNIVGTPADIVCRIYAMLGGVPVGPSIATSEEYTPAEIQASIDAGISHPFIFQTQPPLFGDYFASLETTGPSPTGEYYEPNYNNANPYPGGARWIALNAPWAALSVTDYSGTTDDMRMEIWSVI